MENVHLCAVRGEVNLENIQKSTCDQEFEDTRPMRFEQKAFVVEIPASNFGTSQLSRGLRRKRYDERGIAITWNDDLCALEKLQKG